MSEAPRVLVVEDDAKIASLLADYLKASAYEVTVVGDGAAAVEFARTGNPACILLDLNLPVMDGLEACKAIRRFSGVPIAMVTARVDEIDRLLGLELGADDYICKPFSPREVVARVKALIRRASGAARPPAAAIEIDAERMKALVRGKPVALTAVEFRLLATLAGQPGRVFSRDQLLTAAHKEWRDVGDRSVDSHVRNLRRKLEAAEPGFDCIRSVYGAGYAFELREE
jgi:two-component system, OmpR family, response regulator BaeR